MGYHWFYKCICYFMQAVSLVLVSNPAAAAYVIEVQKDLTSQA
jgi:hypothetical protein